MFSFRSVHLRFTIAETMAIVAAVAVACARPALLVPAIVAGLSVLLGRRRRSVGVAMAVVSACLYAPFGWLLTVDHGWGDYRLLWLDLWPVLPGFVVGALAFHGNDLLEFGTMGLTTLALLTGLTWLGARGGWRLAIAGAIAMAVAVPQGFITYGVFLM